MNERLDLRGLQCPQPVISTKKVLDKADIQTVESLVDDDICVANLQRLARSLKASISAVQHEDGYYTVLISKSAEAKSQGEQPAAAEQSKQVASGEKRNAPDNKQVGSVIFISKEQFGEGDPEFSKTLANVFLQTMFEAGHQPRAILMANSGVKLMSTSSPVRKVLQDFAAAGTDVFACGLCVEFYGLKEEIQKEQITNMFAICEYLNAAEKVIQF